MNPDKRAAIIAALREERSRHTGLYSVWLFDEVEGFAMTCDDPELLSRVRSLAINLRPDLVDAFWAILRIVAPDGLPRLDIPTRDAHKHQKEVVARLEFDLEYARRRLAEMDHSLNLNAAEMRLCEALTESGKS